MHVYMFYQKMDLYLSWDGERFFFIVDNTESDHSEVFTLYSVNDQYGFEMQIEWSTYTH